MTHQSVQELIIDPMMKVYQPPRHIAGDEAAQRELLGTYIDGLKGFPRHVLEEGWQKVKITHENWSWPPVFKIRSECLACTPAPKCAPDVKPDHTDLANKAMQSEEGQQALREGFGHSIWLHVRDTGEFPVTRETMAKMRRGNVDSKAAYRTLSPSIDHHMRLISLYETMEKREAEWQQKYLRRAA